MPAVLKELMRHSSITTTMTYYVSQSAEDVGDMLRMALGNILGNNPPEKAEPTGVERDGKPVRIKG